MMPIGRHMPPADVPTSYNRHVQACHSAGFPLKELRRAPTPENDPERQSPWPVGRLRFGALCHPLIVSPPTPEFLSDRYRKSAGFSLRQRECMPIDKPPKEKLRGHSNTRTQSCRDPCEGSGGFPPVLWGGTRPAAATPTGLRFSGRMVRIRQPGTAPDRRSGSDSCRPPPPPFRPADRRHLRGEGGTGAEGRHRI